MYLFTSITVCASCAWQSVTSITVWASCACQSVTSITVCASCACQSVASITVCASCACQSVTSITVCASCACQSVTSINVCASCACNCVSCKFDGVILTMVAMTSRKLSYLSLVHFRCCETRSSLYSALASLLVYCMKMPMVLYLEIT